MTRHSFANEACLQHRNRPESRKPRFYWASKRIRDVSVNHQIRANSLIFHCKHEDYEHRKAQEVQSHGRRT